MSCICCPLLHFLARALVWYVGRKRPYGYFWFMVLISFTCRLSHPRERHLLALLYYLPYVSSPINLCVVVTQILPGDQRCQRERRRAHRPARVYRTLPKPPRNLYQSAPNGTHVRVKIMVELLTAIVLATKQVKQKRPSESRPLQMRATPL